MYQFSAHSFKQKKKRKNSIIFYKTFLSVMASNANSIYESCNPCQLLACFYLIHFVSTALFLALTVSGSTLIKRLVNSD